MRKLITRPYEILTCLLSMDKEVYFSPERNISGEIVLDDLIRTMKINPRLYNKPVVDLDDYGFLVKGNNHYFEIGSQLGFKSFVCDVNINTLDDKHMSPFQLDDPSKEQRPERFHYIFFLDRNLESSSYRNTGSKFLTDLQFACRMLKLPDFVQLGLIDDSAVELKLNADISLEEEDEIFEQIKSLIANFTRIRTVNGKVL